MVGCCSFCTPFSNLLISTPALSLVFQSPRYVAEICLLKPATVFMNFTQLMFNSVSLFWSFLGLQ